MTHSLDKLRRSAKDLRRSALNGDAAAQNRIAAQLDPPPELDRLRHADCLHVVAREAGYPSWPQLKLSIETLGLDRAARLQRLKIAIAHGQTGVAKSLLDDTPDLAKGVFGLEVAIYDREAVARALDRDPGLATRLAGPVRPIVHLARSRMIHVWPDRAEDMMAIAEMLLVHGADVNDAQPQEGTDHGLPVLYLAIGHADNMTLGKWLLDHGAEPNDGESLYHATELGHHEGLRLLLAAGARPSGTNALLRAIDFDDVQAVSLLLEAGADPNEYDARVIGGEPPFVIPVLHQLARRGASAELCERLLGAGANPRAEWQGASAHAYAQVFGHADLARMIAEAGGTVDLTREETLLAGAARGDVPAGEYINPERLAPAYRDILRDLVSLPGRLDHMKALVALGVEYDRPDEMGLPPVQIAGWEGLPATLGWLISLRPDLTRVNGYGGTLLTTILHGSENAPARPDRDHIECLRLVLDHGVALPRQAIEFAGDPEVAAFLSDWAEAHPGQVVEGVA